MCVVELVKCLLLSSVVVIVILYMGTRSYTKNVVFGYVCILLGVDLLVVDVCAMRQACTAEFISVSLACSVVFV